ncbi:SDR family oxidoreductase [Candidatus Thioglobus sp.]|nr:SDR family oxidoreductase [Candidatus Thioglobus sp.]
MKNLFNLDGKVIVITGASGLLGQMHAEAIAAFGGNPILLDLSQETLNSLSDKLSKKYSVKASGYAVDITNEEAIKENIEILLKQYGEINGLVNNAANNPKVEKTSDKNFSRLENFSLDIWNQDIAVGLTGAFLCAKHYGHQISKNPEGGSIINISSDLGLIAPDQRLYSQEGVPQSQQNVKPVTYSVVKTGIIGLTRYLASYWPEKNVRCNAICPGGVENGQDKEFLKEVSSRIPLGRLAKSNEYQSTLIWMLSDSSGYLNGSIVSVDGGRTVL